MDKEDYPSDSDQSDEDFCPENSGSEDDIHSDEDSDIANNSTDSDGGEKISLKTKKLKSGKKRGRPKKKIEKNPVRNITDTIDDSKVKEDNELVSNDELEKKRSDALWADFLSDVNSTPTKETDADSKEASSTANRSQTSNCKQNEIKKIAPVSKEDLKNTAQNEERKVTDNQSEKVKITEIFDFAGEEIKITKEVPVAINKVEKKTSLLGAKDSPKMFNKGPIKRPAVGGGLSSVLNSINKKTKISVLEKTKMDWDHFKNNEGLTEELTTHNKGKDGYLERQDFLERTDLRQFEIEKSMRQTKRSNR